MKIKYSAIWALALLGVGIQFATFAQQNTKPIINPPPTAKDWANLAKLPDWSGVWNPKITDQDMQAKTNMPPWKPEAEDLIKFQFLSIAYLKQCLLGC